MTPGQNWTQITLVRGKHSLQCAIPVPLWLYITISDNIPVLTYDLQDTPNNLLAHPYCRSRWGSPLATGLDLDTSGQLDSSDSLFDSHCLYKCHWHKECILQALQMGNEILLDMADNAGFLMVHKFHLNTVMVLHLDQHSWKTLN